MHCLGYWLLSVGVYFSTNAKLQISFLAQRVGIAASLKPPLHVIFAPVNESDVFVFQASTHMAGDKQELTTCSYLNSIPEITCPTNISLRSVHSDTHRLLITLFIQGKVYNNNKELQIKVLKFLLIEKKISVFFHESVCLCRLQVCWVCCGVSACCPASSVIASWYPCRLILWPCTACFSSFSSIPSRLAITSPASGCSNFW